MGKPIVILGCTAAGKSDLAEALAVRLGERGGGGPGRVMAVDSMQVYRGMDIGTAKPVGATRARIPYEMVDVADPWEVYSAARFVAEARPLVEKSLQAADSETRAVEEGGVRPERPQLILVGGTFLYLRALVEGLFEGPAADEAIRRELKERAEAEGSAVLHAELARLDPVAAGRIHANDLRRIVRALEVHRLTGLPISELQTQWAAEHPRLDVLYIGVRREKELLGRRINARVKKMIERGLVEEVDRLRRDPRGFAGMGKTWWEVKAGDCVETASDGGSGLERPRDEGGGLESAGDEGSGVEKARDGGRDGAGAVGAIEAGGGPAHAVGYRQLLEYFAGRCTLEAAIEQIKVQTRLLAKMQRTWLKRWPPAGPGGVHWLDAAEGVEGGALVDEALRIIDSDGKARSIT